MIVNLKIALWVLLFVYVLLKLMWKCTKVILVIILKDQNWLNVTISNNDIDYSSIASEEGDVNSFSFVDKSVVFVNSVSNAVSKIAANLYTIDTLTKIHVQEIIYKRKNLVSET